MHIYLTSHRSSRMQEDAQLTIATSTIATTTVTSPPTGSQPVEKGLALPGTDRSHSAWSNSTGASSHPRPANTGTTRKSMPT